MEIYLVLQKDIYGRVLKIDAFKNDPTAYCDIEKLASDDRTVQWEIQQVWVRGMT